MIFALLVGLLAVMGINQYGGSLTMISIADSFRPVKPTLRIRAITIGLMFLLVFSISQLVGVDRFNSFYGNVLIFLTYVFTPWTAINLVDFFFVRRGQYVIAEIFNPNGIYGRWGWRGNLAYLVGIAVMIPFMVTTPYTGFLAKHLGDVDYSTFIGLPLRESSTWSCAAAWTWTPSVAWSPRKASSARCTDQISANPAAGRDSSAPSLSVHTGPRSTRRDGKKSPAHCLPRAAGKPGRSRPPG